MHNGAVLPIKKIVLYSKRSLKNSKQAAHIPKNYIKNKIGTYYLSNDRYLDVIIENDYIIKGIYKSAENEDLYAYNIDISTKEKEIYFIENIYKYLSKECNNEITLNSLNLYN